jgi:hypothetical protein
VISYLNTIEDEGNRSFAGDLILEMIPEIDTVSLKELKGLIYFVKRAIFETEGISVTNDNVELE